MTHDRQRKGEKTHRRKKVTQRQGTWSDVDTRQGALVSTGSHQTVGDVFLKKGFISKDFRQITALELGL